jgi:ABC-type glycerol-3-phosphate transport system permease component
MFTTSVKPEGMAQTIPPTWIFPPTLDHYRGVLEGESVSAFAPLLLHSAVVALGSTALALVLGLMAAYAWRESGSPASRNWRCGSSRP